MKIRGVVLTVLLALGVALGVALYIQRVRAPVRHTFTSAFQIFGETVRVADRLAGRLMPVDDIDEAALGQVLKSHFAGAQQPADEYVNDLLQSVCAHTRKDFSYEAHVIPWNVPNAMAFPGGVIFVTEGLLDTLDNEAQLAAVLAHEVGHVELSHCVDAVKYEITARKLGMAPLGEIADMAMHCMVRSAFSKTQEHEADLYAWTWIDHSRYDPHAVGGSFGALRRWLKRASAGGYQSGLLRDYYASHPPLEVREQEFRNRATRWWRGHAGERRYAGKRNLDQRSALGDGAGSGDEWVTNQ